jgi:hypothetical protein
MDDTIEVDRKGFAVNASAGMYCERGMLAQTQSVSLISLNRPFNCMGLNGDRRIITTYLHLSLPTQSPQIHAPDFSVRTPPGAARHRKDRQAARDLPDHPACSACSIALRIVYARITSIRGRREYPTDLLTARMAMGCGLTICALRRQGSRHGCRCWYVFCLRGRGRIERLWYTFHRRQNRWPRLPDALGYHAGLRSEHRSCWHGVKASVVVVTGGRVRFRRSWGRRPTARLAAVCPGGKWWTATNERRIDLCWTGARDEVALGRLLVDVVPSLHPRNPIHLERPVALENHSMPDGEPHAAHRAGQQTACDEEKACPS